MPRKNASKAPTAPEAQTATGTPAAANAAPPARAARKYADGDVIVSVAANYKRAGSEAFARFAKYRVGMTVGEALDAGLKWVDILWDSNPKNKHITIAPAGSPEADAAIVDRLDVEAHQPR